MEPRQIVSGSAGFIDSEINPFQWRMGPIVRYALSVSESERPRICWLGTAHGDHLGGLRGFYGAVSGEPVEASHLQLFGMPNVDPERHLLGQDVIWVAGGSVVNLLAVWRAHGVDAILREAWERGVVLGGISAGSICWHQGGTTDSFGALRAVTDGLGLLPFSTCVHYDSEPGRRPLYHELIANGTITPGFATDDGAAIHYRGTEVHAVLADTPERYAYRVSRSDSGEVVEEPLAPTLLSA
ncbi:MAG: Type 1 glutamine amidotransferase-like domain-containing protein [Solirubrobacteraceae bacterium]